MAAEITVVCEPEQDALLAPLLADVHAWQAVRALPATQALVASDGFYLHFADDLLRLCRASPAGAADPAGCALEFAELRRRGSGPAELIKACLGSNQGKGVKTLDLFAGWGLDAWQLAARGADIECWEANTIVCALLRDSWRRAPRQWQDLLEIHCGACLLYTSPSPRDRG